MAKQLFTVQATTKIQLYAAKITFDGDAQETTLEGKARIVFGIDELKADVIVLKRKQTSKGALILISADTN